MAELEERGSQDTASDPAKETNEARGKLPFPELATESGWRFFQSNSSVMNVFTFLIDISLRGDYVAYVSKQALDSVDRNDEVADSGPSTEEGHDYESLNPLDLFKKKPGKLMGFVLKNNQILAETFLCRLVDNFTTFLSEIIREALTNKPEMLKSRESLQVEYVLSFNSKEGLVRDLVDRKVAALSYAGFGAIEKWMRERMGVELDVELSSRTEIVELLETRNAIVHNRGYVGDKYLKLVTNPKFDKGQLRRLKLTDVFDSYELLHDCVVTIDRTTAAKFGLLQQPHLNFSDPR